MGNRKRRAPEAERFRREAVSMMWATVLEANGWVFYREAERTYSARVHEHINERCVLIFIANGGN